MSIDKKMCLSFEVFLVFCATADASFSAVDAATDVEGGGRRGVDSLWREEGVDSSSVFFFVVRRCWWSPGPVPPLLSPLLWKEQSQLRFCKSAPGLLWYYPQPNHSYDPDQPYGQAIDRGSSSRCVGGSVIHRAVIPEMCGERLFRLASLTGTHLIVPETDQLSNIISAPNDGLGVRTC